MVLKNANVPRLTGVKSHLNRKNYENKWVDVVLNGESGQLWSGDDSMGRAWTINLSFVHSGGEVRPVNQAIRIYKRV